MHLFQLFIPGPIEDELAIFLNENIIWGWEEKKKIKVR